jgi:FkbM family methyltransferase
VTRLRVSSRIASLFRRRRSPPEVEVRIVLPVRERAGRNIRAQPRRTILLRAPAKLWIPRQLAAHGLAAYEPETIATYLAALDAMPLGVVFDIGANVGIFSVIAAALTRWEIIAFEPVPDLARVAQSVLAQNGLHGLVERMALGAADGVATLYLSDVSDTSNSLLAGFRSSGKSLKVRVETLDTYCARTGRYPSVLKIDTEATEPDVLRGATHLLQQRRPWLICEVLHGRTERALTEQLVPLGYHWYQITGESPLRARDVIEGDPGYRLTNWLFAPEEPSTDFWDAKRAWQRALEPTATAERAGPRD